MTIIEEKLIEVLEKAGVDTPISFTKPPKPDMGDFAFACFDFAKAQGESPAAVATALAKKISSGGLVQDVKAFGPYVNFFLDNGAVASLVLASIGLHFGAHTFGKGKTYAVEFAHPNTHKAFHIGHLRNIITGESICRLHENAGYTVVRVNYQGDVGMHIAKSLWGIVEMKEEYDAVKHADLDARIAFLGKAYAYGAKHFQEDEAVQAAIKQINAHIYTNRDAVEPMYSDTRGWSLEYFDRIYTRVGTRFERLYFESEVFARGKELVEEFLQKGVFKKSDGAIIFEGSDYDLHDRVFINSEGYPTYEGKEVGLAELQFAELSPDNMVHITGSEQAPYFQVVFRAIEAVLPETKGKEQHLTYGWVRLKNGKMSSRLGNVVLGEDLLDSVKEAVLAQMQDDEEKGKDDRAEIIASAAVKYGFLSVQVQKDIAFDMEESVSTVGDSGPYLLYIVARIKSILRKVIVSTEQIDVEALAISSQEKQLLLHIAAYPAVTRAAVDSYDPAKIAKYLFELAQTFNSFYEYCPVVQSSGKEQQFRIVLLNHVLSIMEHGLTILGIRTVESM